MIRKKGASRITNRSTSERCIVSNKKIEAVGFQSNWDTYPQFSFSSFFGSHQIGQFHQFLAHGNGFLSTGKPGQTIGPFGTLLGFGQKVDEFFTYKEERAGSVVVVSITQ